MSSSVAISARTNREFWNDPDRLPERPPLRDVGQRHLQHRPDRRHRARSRSTAAPVGRFATSWRKPCPSSGPSRFPTGHVHVVEEQLGGVLGVLAELVQVAPAGEPGHAALDDQQRHAAVALRGVGLDGGDDQVRVDPVGDEGLGAVDDVVVTVADGGGGHRRQVRADPGLGHADRGDQLAGDDAGQPALLLLVGAVAEEVGQADVVVQGDPQPGAGVRGAQQLLAEHGVEPEVGHSPAAVLLRHVHAEKPLPTGGGEQLAGRDPGGAPLVDVRGDLLVDERAHGCAEGLVVVVVQRAAHAASSVPAGHGDVAALTRLPVLR